MIRFVDLGNQTANCGSYAWFDTATYQFVPSRDGSHVVDLVELIEEIQQKDSPIRSHGTKAELFALIPQELQQSYDDALDNALRRGCAYPSFGDD